MSFLLGIELKNFQFSDLKFFNQISIFLKLPFSWLMPTFKPPHEHKIPPETNVIAIIADYLTTQLRHPVTEEELHGCKFSNPSHASGKNHCMGR